MKRQTERDNEKQIERERGRERKIKIDKYEERM